MITFLKEVLKINKIFKTIKRLVSTRTGATSRQAIKVVAGFKPAPAKKVDNQKTPLSHNLDANLSGVRQALGSASDLVIRRFNIGGAKGQQAALIFLDGFVDVNRIGDQILRPVSERVDAVTVSQLNPGQLLRHLQQDILPVADIKHYGMLEKVLEQVLGGYTALFCDGANMALAMDTIAFEHRDVAEPTQETVIRGPKEGLNENIQNNIIMIRRKITHPQLRFDKITIGRYSQTQVIVVYINDVAEASLVQEVKDRLSRVDIDGVIESGCLEQLIEDTPYSLFPTIGNTEKPDTVVARILEGKVAVLVDGTPVALTMPHLFLRNHSDHRRLLFPSLQCQYGAGFKIYPAGYYYYPTCTLLSNCKLSPRNNSYPLCNYYCGGAGGCTATVISGNTDNGFFFRRFTGGRGASAPTCRTSGNDSRSTGHWRGCRNGWNCGCSLGGGNGLGGYCGLR